MSIAFGFLTQSYYDYTAVIDLVNEPHYRTTSMLPIFHMNSYSPNEHNITISVGYVPIGGLITGGYKMWSIWDGQYADRSTLSKIALAVRAVFEMLGLGIVLLPLDLALLGLRGLMPERMAELCGNQAAPAPAPPPQNEEPDNTNYSYQFRPCPSGDYKKLQDAAFSNSSNDYFPDPDLDISKGAEQDMRELVGTKAKAWLAPTEARITLYIDLRCEGWKPSPFLPDLGRRPFVTTLELLFCNNTAIALDQEINCIDVVWSESLNSEYSQEDVEWIVREFVKQTLRNGRLKSAQAQQPHEQ